MTIAVCDEVDLGDRLVMGVGEFQFCRVHVAAVFAAQVMGQKKW
jgi:hypothetical protein